MSIATLNRTTRTALAAALSLTAGAASAVGVTYEPTTFASAFGGVPFSTGPGYIGGMSNDNVDPLSPSFTAGFVIHNDAAAPQYGATRRPVVEVDLSRIKNVSTDPNDVTSATFDFYIDDAVFASSRGDRIINSFVLELYTDTADGAITSEPDSDGPNADYDGGAIATVNFTGVVTDVSNKPALDAGWINGDYTETLAPGVVYTGTTGDTINYISNYSDADFDSRGFLGFQIDVTSALHSVLSDPGNDYLGFRIYTIEDDTPYTSLDRVVDSQAGIHFQPTLNVEVVPEPGAAALLFGGLGLVGLRRRRA